MTGDPNTLGPLALEDVSYLALEGGGGKGVAFLGAIEALESLGVLRHTTGPSTPPPDGHLTWLRDVDQGRRLVPDDGVKGIAGASAGAITALMLSCGYNAADIRTVLSSFPFDDFFDPPRPRKIPRISGVVDPHDREAAFEIPTGSGPFPNVERLLNVLRPRFPSNDLGPLRPNDLVPAVLKLAPLVVHQIAGGLLPRAVDILFKDFDDYVDFLPQDMGFFSGCAARAFFADLLAFKLPRRNGKLQYNATFEDHYDWFGVELAVTGTNLESGKSGIFSRRTTKHFPVADAVRISMSLPLAYKPYVIREEHYAPLDLPRWVEGVWIDGGYLNNLPLHAFDQHGGIRRTLGLRLEIDKTPEPIDSFTKFLGRWPFQFGFLGAGEAHVSPGTSNDTQTVVLDTAGLDLLKFTYPDETIDEVSERTRKQVLDYFPGF